jgi:hypothetical protein
MAATYPSMQAAGVTVIGRFDQFDLYAGEKDIVTSQAQVASGVAVPQFAVLSMNTDGTIAPWDGSEFGYATGSITLTSNPSASDTVTINGVVITFVASGATGAQVNIGTAAADTATNLAALINGVPDSVDPDTSMPVYGTEPLAGVGVTAQIDGSNAAELDLASIAPGTAGNAITLATSDAGKITVSGATLSGGAAETDTNAVRAIGIAAQPAAAATPGVYIPYFTGGIFNHEVLVWPAAVSTLAQRKRAFAGTDIGIGQLL